MIGAIAGDIIGSAYEHDPIETKVFFPLFHPRARFADDGVLTVAIADAILTGRSYRDTVREWGRRYPRAGYGGMFAPWLSAGEPRPYPSWGNGAAMRVGPVGWALTSEEEVRQARPSAATAHDHPEGIKGAQATALAIYLARTGTDKATIRARPQADFGYELARTVDAIRPGHAFDASCQGTVPEAPIAFLDAESYEDTVRNAVSLGGDSDTLARIAGAVAEAFHDRDHTFDSFWDGRPCPLKCRSRSMPRKRISTGS